MEENNPIHKVEILSLDGRLVRIVNNNTGSRTTIGRNNLSPGMYILRIHADDVYVKKIVVE